MVFKSNGSQSFINEINALNFYHPTNYTNYKLKINFTAFTQNPSLSWNKGTPYEECSKLQQCNYSYLSKTLIFFCGNFFNFNITN